MSKKTIRLYAHGSRDSNYETATELGLDGEAAKTFSYSLYEVAFDCEVDTKTGETTIVSIDALDGGPPFTREEE